MPWQSALPGGDAFEFSHLCKDDFEGLFEAASDPLIWEQHPDKLRYTLKGFTTFFEKALGRDCQTLLVREKATGRIMGSSRYYRYGSEDKSVYIGFTFLRREYWGSGWNTKLKSAMISHAAKYCHRILFEAAKDNKRSVAALLKLGAVQLRHPETGKCLFEIRGANFSIQLPDLSEIQ